MNTEARKRLLREAQPFGHVMEQPMMPPTMANKAAHSNANLGPDDKNGNNGKTVIESFEDKNPRAYAEACVNRDNPFAFVGKKFELGKSNLGMTAGNTNAI